MDLSALTELMALFVFLAGTLVGGLLVALWSRLRQQGQLARHALQAQQQLAESREQLLVSQTQLDNSLLEKQSQQLNIDDKDRQLLQLQATLAASQAQQASLKTQLDLQEVDAREKIALLQQAREQLSSEFEALANRIFEAKNERFSQQSKNTLDGALNPLREQLTDFKKKVEDIYDKDSKERVSLVAELGQLKALNLQMSEDALDLTNALKGDNKAQGNWGEVILERVLEESGLRKGHEYDTQVSLQSEQGGRRNPDVIVRLPEGKDIIIDSKVSLLHYERYCNCEDPEQKAQLLKQHAQSVRGHISGLSVKDYENLDNIRTLDFVFIFIPVEAAFMAAFEYDQGIFSEAYEKNIIVVGPTTLLATLRTVQSIWRYERQNKNAEEIARQAGAMHDKFVAFVDDLNKIAYYLDKAGDSQSAALNKLSSGRGNLVNSTQRLQKLGAKVKKSMPANVIKDSDEPVADIGHEDQALESQLPSNETDSIED